MRRERLPGPRPRRRHAPQRASGLPDGKAGRGKAVQVDPIKPTLKAPGSHLLTLKYDKLLSCFGFKFNLRRCNVAAARLPPLQERVKELDAEAGAYTRSLLSSA